MTYQSIISKEELNQLKLRHFDGDIFVIDTLKEADKAANYLKQFDTLGFDTETKPSFKKGCVHSVALLQLSTQHEAFLFRVNKIGLPQSVIELLHDKNIVKTGVAIRDDIRGLQKIHNFSDHGFVELQDAAKELGFENISLKKLAGLVLNFRISKSQQLSNWEAAKLTPPQQSYAATDAWVSYELYIHMKQIDAQDVVKVNEGV